MYNEFHWSDCFLGIVIGMGILFCIIGISGKLPEDVRQACEKDAIESGHAEYTVNSDRQTTFVWLDK